jgi:hypothetical protein
LLKVHLVVQVIYTYLYFEMGRLHIKVLYR